MNNQTEPSTDLQTSTNDDPSANIEPQAQTSAAGGTAEDTLGQYKALTEQLMAQNKALIEQNKSLQSQFGVLIRNGASVGHQGEQPESQPEPEKYVSLAELGSEIGKRDYRSHNIKKE